MLNQPMAIIGAIGQFRVRYDRSRADLTGKIERPAYAGRVIFTKAREWPKRCVQRGDRQASGGDK